MRTLPFLLVLAACTQEELDLGPPAEELELPDLTGVDLKEAYADALRIANDSRFGLGASIWTGSRRRGEALTSRLEAGCVFVNEIVKSDPRLPFGGVKQSGVGRELGAAGIREFTNVKTVWVG